MSYVLTAGVARQAVEMVRPAIEAFLSSEFAGGRRSLHLVVLKPGTMSILHEETIGEGREGWRNPYDEVALAKARLCFRTGLAARTVQTDAPWLFEEGDTRFPGGVIENGLVVAASGLKDHFDEMFSWMVLSAIQALCRDFVATRDANAPVFLGKIPG
jgi:hypothetical protein